MSDMPAVKTPHGHGVDEGAGVRNARGNGRKRKRERWIEKRQFPRERGDCDARIPIRRYTRFTANASLASQWGVEPAAGFGRRERLRGSEWQRGDTVTWEKKVKVHILNWGTWWVCKKKDGTILLCYYYWATRDK